MELGRITHRRLTQKNCETLVTVDAWTSRNVPIEVSSELIADGVCRTCYTDSDNEACQMHVFTNSSLVTTIVKKRSPNVDHEFVSAKFRFDFDSKRNMVETWEFFGPSGEDMGSQTKVWKRQ